jgi:hypothetical protein
VPVGAVSPLQAPGPASCALALLAMRRQDQKNMHRIREALESSTVTSDWQRGPDLRTPQSADNQVGCGSMSFRLSFHLVLLGLTGARWMDSPLT